MCVVDDGLGPGGKVQCGLGLTLLEEGGGAHDGRLGVAAEAVLQDPGQLGTPENRNSQRIYYWPPAFGLRKNNGHFFAEILANIILKWVCIC